MATDILIVGGGTGATVAAIQAARRGCQTIIITEFEWLGGMLTSAGVCAPDGNELVVWRTGVWGAYWELLEKKQVEGLNHAWVSLLTYHPAIGAEILAQWVRELPNLQWISGQTPKDVLKTNNRITGVKFTELIVEAKITIDGTELGDLLALGDIPHRWGWELQAEFNEPCAPVSYNELTNMYPVQSPTWVVILQDYGEGKGAPEIMPPPNYNPEKYRGAWDNYGGQHFLNYGRLPNNLFMINWPICGNDYDEKIGRLIGGKTAKQEFLQEAYWHSQGFAYFIQSELGRRYGLAENVFPGAFALHPYYRESRRLIGQTTMTEWDILPVNKGCIAALPMTKTGEVASIAIGNYPNDHHYPGVKFNLTPKSIRWGGRWTGTPFTIPYACLVPATNEGLLVCEKNISVSHIANGSTRLQPVVMNIGQAAGMAAALCIALHCQPHELSVREIQEALLTDAIAPAAVVPLFNLPPDHPDWLYWQRYYLDHPEEYPLDGNCPCQNVFFRPKNTQVYQGIFQRLASQEYQLIEGDKIYSIITARPEVNQQLESCVNGQLLSVWASHNASGGWLVVEYLE